MLARCERTPTDAVDLNYKHNEKFVVCAASFVPIYIGEASIKCSYCQSSYKPNYKDHICSNCELTKIGRSALGMKNKN